MITKGALFLVCVLAFFGIASAKDLSVTVEHSLDGGKSWSARGTLSYTSSHCKSAGVSAGASAERVAISQGWEAVNEPATVSKFWSSLPSDLTTGLYKIRVATGSGNYVTASTPWCMLNGAEFKDSIVLHVAKNGVPLGLSYSPSFMTSTPICSTSSSPSVKRSHELPFESKTYLGVGRRAEGAVIAPPPRAADGTVVKPDERGFLSKYWYILLPAVFMLSNLLAPPEEAPRQGGGGGGGGRPQGGGGGGGRRN